MVCTVGGVETCLMLVGVTLPCWIMKMGGIVEICK